MDVPPPVVTVDLTIGEIIGHHYVLLSQIGAGAFGAIFSVKYKHGNIKRKVALKFEEGLGQFTFLHNEIVVLKSLAATIVVFSKQLLLYTQVDFYFKSLLINMLHLVHIHVFLPFPLIVAFIAISAAFMRC
ncbi:MAG: hypothetical protein EZS28_036696 [Streblomastix strix]|uniref:Protein kinase domain-containing protein n=1 Tax=Streblomastix strix TaxID=222440 RepID=A0A5J4UA93_9EUKA|nr:MAG: hypothetical protein EZS28_036696 [Streblomastix strix]